MQLGLDARSGKQLLQTAFLGLGTGQGKSSLRVIDCYRQADKHTSIILYLVCNTCSVQYFHIKKKKKNNVEGPGKLNNKKLYIFYSIKIHCKIET